MLDGDGGAAICVAPVKGATMCLRMRGTAAMYFNPRSREGSDSKNHQDYPDDFRKINNYNNSFAQIRAKHNCKFDIR